MVGPVLYLELLLGSRRGRQIVFRCLLGAWLVLLFLFDYLILYRAQVLRWQWSGPNLHATSEFAEALLQKLLVQQLFIVLLATPALIAGAITDEKSTGTLQYLLAADLTAWEIVLGKLLGRITQVAVLSSCALPFIFFVGVFSGFDPLVLALLVVVLFLPAFAVAAMSLLASVWSKQTRDAVLGVYCVGIVGYLGLRYLGGLDYVNPLYALEPIWLNEGVPELLRRLPMLLVTWGTIGAVCLGLATWRLRPAYFKQLQGQERPKKARWWRARRAIIAEEPIRWKERHVEGIAPLASLRRIPRWLGMALIAAWTFVFAVGILVGCWRGRSPETLLGHLQAFRLEAIWDSFPGASDGFTLLGSIAGLLATLIVAIRCSGAVTGERERQTWEALLLTPLPVRHLIRSKLWGIIGACYPYLAAYAVPALLLAFFGGLRCMVLTAGLLLATWLGMCFTGAAGLCCSARCKTSWRSLLFTLGISYVLGFFLVAMSFPLIFVLYVVIMLALMVLDASMGTSLARAFMGGWWPYAIGSYLVILGWFVFLRWYLIRDAEKYVADRERIRHWKEEPIVRLHRKRVVASEVRA